MDKEHKIESLRHFIGILENAINQMNESEKTAYSGYANDLRKLKKKKGEELRSLLKSESSSNKKISQTKKGGKRKWKKTIKNKKSRK